MNDTSAKSTERRTFLAIILGGISAVIAGAFSWPMFRFLAPIDRGGENQQVRVPRSEIKVGQAHFFSYQGRPAVLLQPSPGEFLALSAVCTHLGCLVKWVDAKQEFLCPCHGGRFSTAGQVIGGPPPKPLETYAVLIEGDEILIG